MRRNLKRILAAAAVLFAGGGITLGVALQQASDADVRPMNCERWERATKKIAGRNIQPVFLLVDNGISIPEVFNNRIIGECAAGVCTVDRADCSAAAYTYSFERSDLIAGRRLYQFKSPGYHTLSLKRWANNTAGVDFIGGYQGFRPACTGTGYTNLQCRNAFNDVEGCWRQADGQYCRRLDDGVSWGLYGPGEGGTTACTPGGAGLTPVPCDGDGPTYEARVTGAFPSDAELDLQE